eukprot:gene1480-1637_t
MFRFPSIPKSTEKEQQFFMTAFRNSKSPHVKNCKLLGSFATAVKGRYKDAVVVMKKFNPAMSKLECSTYAKEAKLLSEIDCRQVVKFMGVCERPLAIMFEYCEFSFSPFEREHCVNSLKDFLVYMHAENLFPHFQGIGNIIAKDIMKGVSYMHDHDIVHRDIKPANILVSNLHYSSLKSDFAHVFKEMPISCKLGEARSKACATKTMVENTRTSFLNRGSPAFMAPEIQVESLKIQSASVEELKAIDIWALLMTIFIVINPDQRFPFEDNITKMQPKSSADYDSFFLELLKGRAYPSCSGEYTSYQASYYQKLRQLFYDNLAYDISERCNIAALVKMIEDVSITDFLQLDVSQATAMAQNDEELIHAYLDNVHELTTTVQPANDGTNACAFLSIGIVDRLMSSDDKALQCELEVCEMIQNTIREYPRAFNSFRNSGKMYDVFEAVKVLQENRLLAHQLQFTERIVENKKLYSYHFQVRMNSEIAAMKNAAMTSGVATFAIFQAATFIFAIAGAPDGHLYAFETHPILECLGGNGNGLIIKANSLYNPVQARLALRHLQRPRQPALQPNRISS